MEHLSPIMRVMQGAARKASRGLLRDFGEVENLQVSRKGPADFVSRADKKAEEVIFENLDRDRPGYSYLMEESGEIVGTDKTHRFIIDPLDGTTNFLHGIPHFAISIALEREIDDQPREVVAGIVYNPVTDEMFMAEKGKGAFLNDGARGGTDRRLYPTKRDIFTDSIFATGIPFLGRPGHTKFLKELHQVMGASSGVRRMGAASLDLAWCAAGRYDGFWERGLAPWDLAAGVLIAREAGLMVESLSGGDPVETGDVITTNAALMPHLKKRVQ
ncbi:inositol monophosphatase family protein [Litorimonas sp. RW-G-Af-16]|uniref:inositol monophosphatase family protein n=1 Tax=Litorimonas sp. RW-G-Af-16 TaxID=3241168 RepID=UPI00390C5A3D